MHPLHSSSYRPERAEPPKAVWPSQKAQLHEVQSLADRKTEEAFDHYQRVKASAHKLASLAAQQPQWPAQPSLLHPDLKASTLRRAGQQAQASAHKSDQAQQLWQAYRHEQARMAGVVALFVKEQPPPRIVHMVGGIEAYAALPDVSGLPNIERLLQTGLPHPVARGLEPQGSLFVAITFQHHRRQCQDDATKPLMGIIVLRRVGQDPHSGWTMSNPHHFRPAPSALRGHLTLFFPNMSGRGGLIGGPQAQSMYQALCALIKDGQHGPFRLVPSPMPQVGNAL